MRLRSVMATDPSPLPLPLPPFPPLTRKSPVNLAFIYVDLFINLSVFLSVCLSIQLSIYLIIHLSYYSYLSIYLSNYLSIYLLLFQGVQNYPYDWPNSYYYQVTHKLKWMSKNRFSQSINQSTNKVINSMRIMYWNNNNIDKHRTPKRKKKNIFKLIFFRECVILLLGFQSLRTELRRTQR